MWADRIVSSDIAGQLLGSGLATADELRQIAAAWQDWAAEPDGWLSLLHGEIPIRVSVRSLLPAGRARSSCRAAAHAALCRWQARVSAPALR
jgi:hypothetical protein